MLLTYLYNGRNINNDKIPEEVESDYDWQRDKLKYSNSQIKGMPSWLEKYE